MSIFDNISYGPRAHGIRKISKLKEIAEKVLKSVYLWENVKDRIFSSALELSGGQQQRLCIARALAVRPKILLMDEPTSALDPEMVKEVLNVMENLAQSGMTMITVTHEMKFAREIGSRILFMDDGKILEDETPDEFFENPKHERVKEFLSKIL